MANLTRSAKSGKDWTEYDLMAYNTSINIQDQNLQDFFGVAAVEALPDVPASLNAFVTTEDRDSAPDDDTYRLLHFLDLAHTPKVGQEAAFDLFAEKLLDRLGYSQGRRITLIQQALPLLICGSVCSGQTDVCVLNSSTEILLLVQGDSRMEYSTNPEPQVISAAITAFQRNNFIRERQLHLPMLDQMVFPAITMRGTFPVFYQITVTAALNDAVISGLFPVATTVFCHIPRVPGRNIEGMKNLANRSGLLRYLVAFKQFVVRVCYARYKLRILESNPRNYPRLFSDPLTSWDDPKSRRGHSDRPITTIIDSSVFKILEQQFLNCSNFSGVDWQKN